MKSLTFTYADEKFDRLIERNAEAMGYVKTIPNPERFDADPDTAENPHTIPNPESAEQFVHRSIHQQFISNIKSVERKQAMDVVKKEAEDKVTSDYS